MKTEDKKLIYVFVTLVIIILAGFATTIYYIQTNYISRRGEEVTGLFVKAFADKTIGAAPLNVTFSSLLLNFEGTPTYSWEFGDGNTSSEKNPKHNYAKAGTYTCNLTTTDITGKIAATSVDILVTINNPPTVVAMVNLGESPRADKPYGLTILLRTFMSIPIIGGQLYTKFLENLKPASSLYKIEGWITCEAQVTDLEGDEIVNYTWELTQPSITLGGIPYWPKFYFVGNNLSTITFPLVYTYRTGNYEARVNVTDSAGNTRSDSKKFIVGISPLESLKWTIKKVWDSFWGINFNGKPSYTQKILLLIWIILRPIHNLTDNIVTKILSPLPPTIRDLLYTMYYLLVWQPKEIKYHEPNWNAPKAPSNPSPLDGATDVSLYTNLSWSCSDLDDDPLTYDVYFGMTSPPPLVIQGQSKTTFALGPLLPGTTYYWRIAAKDHPLISDPKITDGPLWSFTTAL